MQTIKLRPVPVETPDPVLTQRGTVRRVSPGRVGLTLALALLVAGAAGLAWYVREVQSSYRDARASAETIQVRYTDPASVTALSPSDLPQLNADLGQLQSDLKDLQGLVDVPLLGGIARHAPIVGDDVSASQDLIDLGLELTDIATDATAIADEVRLAFETSGMAAGDGGTEPTWLDVVRAHRAEIDSLETRFDVALAQRAALDVDGLPQRGKNMLPQIDGLLARAAGIRDEYFSALPLLDTAFGADGDARYLILLQNREEIRPGGGFPGTYAVVTLSDGQLEGYQGNDIHTLDAAYVAHRKVARSAPGPIRTVIGQQEYLPHDALWSPDFTEAAQTFLSMYDESGEPPLTGVIGLNDSAIQDVLAIVGPYQVEIEGQQQTVSADSYLSLIESYRDQTWQDLAAHKHVVSILGASLIDQIKAADVATKKRIYFALRDAADRREIQVYMRDPAMQAEVVKRGWDGALHPDPQTPTLAMTVAGLTGGKKSLMISATTEVEFEPAAGGQRVTWTIALHHNGDRTKNQIYNGYEFAWLSLYLPEGARLVSTSLPAEPADVADDTRAVSIGIGLMPGTTESVTVVFELPGETERLLLRRQAGFNDVGVRAFGSTGRCSIDWSLALTRDYVVDLTACTAAPAR